MTAEPGDSVAAVWVTIDRMAALRIICEGVMARRPMLQADDERYSAAIEELSRALGAGGAFQAARLWALDQCRKAQQMSWPTSSMGKKGLAKTWNSASAAWLRSSGC
jgi:hypothetical protein